MRPFLILIACSLFSFSAIAQIRLDVDGDASVTGDLHSGGIFMNGSAAARLTSTSSAILDLRANDPLVEFRDVSGGQLSFIQAFNNDFYVANRLAGNLIFRTSNINRMVIASNGNIGIGNFSPQSKLVVTGGDNNGTSAGVEINSASQKMLLDGNEIDAVTTPLYLNYNSTEDLLVRTATRRAEITLSHTSGSGAGNGLAIENEAPNHVYWTLYSTNGDGNFELYYKGAFRGEFNSSTGAYTQISDRRLKENIRPLDEVLERVSRLKPSSFHFRDSHAKDRSLGFIAQEVQPIFPELVHHGQIGDSSGDIYTLDYSGFSVIAVEAIRELLDREKAEKAELQTENRELKNRVDQLADRLERMEQQLSSCCRAQENLAPSPLPQLEERFPEGQPHLAQNVPNPFREATSIQYYLPESANRAEIRLADAAGKEIRTFRIDQSGYGKVTIEGGTLTAGTYTYSLVIDGAIWQSLPMVMTR